MKILFIGLILIGACLCSNIFLQKKLEWERFKVEYEKVYESEIEELERFQIFLQNLETIKELNSDADDQAEYGISPFSDLTPKEFKLKILMPTRHPVEHPEERYLFKNVQLKQTPVPSYFDWTQHGAVTPVKNQGSVGTCWAFSTCGNVEGQWFLAGNELVSLSEEQLTDCAGNTNPPDALCGVFGGWPYLAYEYIQQVGGIASNASYPYCVGIGGKSACYPCTAPTYNETLCGPGLEPPMCNDTKWPCLQGKVPYTAYVQNWSAISQNETEIQQSLLNVGPLSVLLNAQKLQFYRKGVFSPKRCNPKNLDHAVLLTGYGVTNSTDTQDPNTPYWIVKNSWGTKWGIDGYFWIERGVGMCGINTQVTTSIVDTSLFTTITNKFK